MKRATLLLCLSLVLHSFASAGDLSTFVNLGFSTNSENFAFASYGIKADDSPFADIYLVDLPRNDFLKDGQITYKGRQSITLGQDGSSTLYKALTLYSDRLAKAKIDLEKQGRLIYVMLGNDEAKKELSFKDFASGTDYFVVLDQKAKDGGSSFGINLKVSNKDGSSKTYLVGRPNLVRKDVSSYRISQIILAPNEKNLVIVLEKSMVNGKNSISTDYMVETVALKP